MKLWKERLEKENIELLIYNKESLLNKVLPIFNWKEINEKKKKS